jgi:hypothetical protein
MARALADLYRGELHGANRERLERHLSRCAACRETMRGWEAADRLLHVARPEPVVLTPLAAQALFARALHQSGVQRRWTWRNRLQPLIWGLGLTCVAFYLLLPRPHVGHPKPPQVVRVPAPPPSHLPVIVPPIMSPARELVVVPRQLQQQQTLAQHWRRHRQRRSMLPAITHHRWRRHESHHPQMPVQDDEAWVAIADLPQTEPLPDKVPALTTEDPKSEIRNPKSEIPLQGSLLVMVTHEPELMVEVTHTAEDRPGYAQVASARCETEPGRGIWRCCTQSRDSEGRDTSVTEVAFIAQDRQEGSLTVQVTRDPEPRKEEGQ